MGPMTRTGPDAAQRQPVEIDIAVHSNNPKQSKGDSLNEEICPNQALATRLEALLINTDRPLTEARMAEILGLTGKSASKNVVAAIQELNAFYDQTSRAFRAERLAGGWQLLTMPAFGPVLSRLHTDRQQSRLSQPALETLAIIAYRQPIMRAEIEAIRGVASGEVLRGLLERRLIKIVGRAEELGRPMLYGTTKEFLKVFGLSGVDDLPAIKGINPPAAGGGPRRDRSASSSGDSADDKNSGPTGSSPAGEPSPES